MGVTGLTSLLVADGFMPPKNGCNQSLWYTPPPPSSSSNSQQQQQHRIVVPRGSSLHLDGNGFAHWLNGVAYSRWYNDVLMGVVVVDNKNDANTTTTTTTSQKKDGSLDSCTCPRSPMKKLTPEQVTKLLPQFLPFTYLETAVHDFLRPILLQQQQQHPSSSSSGNNNNNNDNMYQLYIYWDGPYRRMKAGTTQKRYHVRSTEWNHYQQYCDYGVLPFTCCCQRNFYHSFPKSKLLVSQVQATLRSYEHHYQQLSMITCQEEADAEIAKASVATSTNGYILGLDSDYCLFRNTRYLPLTSLSILLDDDDTTTTTTSFLTANCITRQDLATEMDLSNDSLLVELAILAGNDFLEANKQAELDYYPPNKFEGISQIVDFLALQPPTYQATSSNPSIQLAMNFCRALYNLESLQEFPLDGTTTTTTNHTMMIDEDDDMMNNNNNNTGGTTTTTLSGDRPVFPPEINLELAIPNPLDHTFVEVIIRPLQEYVNNNNSRTTGRIKLLTLEHLDALRQVNTMLSSSTTHHPSSFNIGSYYAGIQQQQQGLLMLDTTPAHQLKRPKWEDVVATYIIERVILYIMQTSLQAPIVRYQTPRRIWNSSLFHSVMNHKRNTKKERQNATSVISNRTTTTTASSSNTNYSTTTTTSTSINVNATNEGGGVITNHHRDAFDDDDDDDDYYASPQEQQGPIVVAEEQVRLPIDEHEDEILQAVQRQRITIIHGDTGCGKSSRVPVMLLRAPPPPDSSSSYNNDGPPVKLFVSQPRRIAAKSLVDRVRSCEPDLRNVIALRMGHGIREYETSQTRAWFVTTGYLVRLLANHPEKFDNITYLIIDEVHERSVDTDLLCLLCRRLLAERNHRIRLILMSATLAADMYANYFGVPEQPLIEVGARRFPIQEFFVEDLAQRFRLAPSEVKLAKEITAYCEKNKCKSAPGGPYCDKLFKLATKIVAAVGEPGVAILIFVPGMSDIISIIDLIEKIHSPGIVFTTTPIHSDIPFEEQMTAFDPPACNEVKVIVATNAAESSVTLPSVDHVICSGLCKQVVYNPTSHRQMLTSAWISKASATQRAGRTGRVREGNVYRLYTKRAYNEYMDKFERGEMLRIPLDSVILLVKEILQEEGTVPVLLQTLEPPDMDNIDRSFQSLHRNFFLDQPNDGGSITKLGAFVQAIGVDLALGSLIGLGTQFGVGPEAIEMAAVMSFPKTVWSMASTLFHEAPEFNDLTTHIFQSKCHFDAKLYSEPLATMNLMYEFERIMSSGRGASFAFCKEFAIHQSRLKRLMHMRDNLRKRVADFVGIVNADDLIPKKPPSQLDPGKLTILRCLQVWVFSDSVVEAMHVCNPTGEGYIPVTLRGKPVEEWHLEQVLNKERHSFELVTNQEMEQTGRFYMVTDQDFNIATFIEPFTERLVSYGVEKNYEMLYYSYKERLVMLVLYDLVSTPSFIKFKFDKLAGFDEVSITAYKAADGAGSNKRGRGERACGQWQIRDGLGSGGGEDDDEFTVSFQIFCSSNASACKGMTKYLRQKGMQIDGLRAIFGCELHKYEAAKVRRSPSYKLSLFGAVEEVTMVDLRDLFATPNVDSRTKMKARGTQQVRFSIDGGMEGYQQRYRGKKGIQKAKNKMQDAFLSQKKGALGGSWSQPLLNDIPEGARILSVLASCNRRHGISFENGKDDAGEPNAPLGVTLSRTETRINERWKRLGTDIAVYLQENSVPAAAVCTGGAMEVFACCANALEVKGGGIRVETLTLLPPGRTFVLLAFLTFGMRPFHFIGDDDDTDELVDQGLGWLQSWYGLAMTLGVVTAEDSMDYEDIANRIASAHAFHRSSWYMGEALVCQPDRVRALLDIFVGVDPYLTDNEWEGLARDPFLPKEEREPEFHMTARATNGSGNAGKPTTRNRKKDYSPNGNSTSRPRDNSKGRSNQTQDPQSRSARRSSAGSIQKQDSGDGSSTNRSRQRRRKKEGSALKAQFVEVRREQAQELQRLFLGGLEDGQELTSASLPSTNILSMVVKGFCQLVIDRNLMPEDRTFIEQASSEGFNAGDWEIFRVEAPDDLRVWYFADYVASVVPYLPVKGRSSKKRLDKWIFQGLCRPLTSKEAMACVPPDFSSRIDRKVFPVNMPGARKLDYVVAFNSVETALRMGAAYWMERQFADGERHWYVVPMEEMMDKLSQSVGLT